MRHRSIQESPRLFPSLLGAVAIHALIIAHFTASSDSTPALRASVVPTVAVEVAWPAQRIAAEAPESGSRTQTPVEPLPGKLAPSRNRTQELSGARAVSPDHTSRATEPRVSTIAREGEEFPLLNSAPGFGADPGRGTSGDGSMGRGESDGSGEGKAGGHAAVNQSAGPLLLAGSSQCGDLFPYAARVSRGVVTVSVDVDEQGQATFGGVSQVSPNDQGFEEAARFCAPRLRFRPAVDARGETTTSSTRVRLLFQRAH